MPNCPFCSTKKNPIKMKRMKSGLPGWINLGELLKSHPIPILRNWVKSKLEEAASKASQKVIVYKCPKCGLILFFEI